MLFDLALYIYRATCRVRSKTVFASECSIVHTRVSSETIDAEGRPLSAPPVKTPRSKRRDVSNFAQPFPRNMRRFDKRLLLASNAFRLGRYCDTGPMSALHRRRQSIHRRTPSFPSKIKCSVDQLRPPPKAGIESRF